MSLRDDVEAYVEELREEPTDPVFDRVADDLEEIIAKNESEDLRALVRDYFAALDRETNLRHRVNIRGEAARRARTKAERERLTAEKKLREAVEP